MGDDSGEAAAPKRGLARFAATLTGVRTFFVDVIVIAAVAGFAAFLLLDALLNRHIVIEEIGLPKPIEDMGYTGQIASLRLWDALHEVNEKVRRHTDLEEETPLLAERSQIEITAPGTGMSLGDLRGLVDRVFGTNRRISGEFVCLDPKCEEEVRLLLRVVDGGEVHRIEGGVLRVDAKPMPLDEYFEDIGRRVLEVAHPILMGEYYNGRDDAKAEAILKHIVDQADDDPSAEKHAARAMTVLGQMHLAAGDLPDARTWLHRAVARAYVHDHAMAATARTLLGEVEVWDDNADVAEAAWRDAIKRFELVPVHEADSVLALLWRGFALERLGDSLEMRGFRYAANSVFFEPAKASYHRVMTLHPDNLGGHVYLGTLLYSLGEDTEAEEVFLAAAERFPDEAMVHVAWGNALISKGRGEKAAEVRREAAWRSLTNRASAIGLGRVAVAREKDFPEAELARALAADADDAIANFEMGVALLNRRSHTGAIAYFVKAAEAAPDWDLPVEFWSHALQSRITDYPNVACMAIREHLPRLRSASDRAGLPLPPDLESQERACLPMP
jgi:tetratricopeptide (TPR) repeat protein